MAYEFQKDWHRKGLIFVLVVLFLVLQYKLWFSRGGVYQVQHLKNIIAAQTTENLQLQKRNAVLTAEIQGLKNGQAAVEESARNDLGMVKSGEIFYQVVDK